MGVRKCSEILTLEGTDRSTSSGDARECLMRFPKCLWSPEFWNLWTRTNQSWVKLHTGLGHSKTKPDKLTYNDSLVSLKKNSNNLQQNPLAMLEVYIYIYAGYIYIHTPIYN